MTLEPSPMSRKPSDKPRGQFLGLFLVCWGISLLESEILGKQQGITEHVSCWKTNVLGKQQGITGRIPC